MTSQVVKVRQVLSELPLTSIYRCNQALLSHYLNLPLVVFYLHAEIQRGAIESNLVTGGEPSVEARSLDDTGIILACSFGAELACKSG